MTLYHYYWGEAYDDLMLAFHIRSADYPTEEAFEADVQEAEHFMHGFIGERESGPYTWTAMGQEREARPDGQPWHLFRQTYVTEGRPTPVRRRR